ncbi:MAG TPA: S8 family serine peptidase [Burkholderiaceae bacterium]|nr:S8 family serine peptidase [Burkholderiaceae bacterium]
MMAGTLRAIVLVLCALGATAAHAERVIVRFKPDAELVRAHALPSARAESPAPALQARAAALGARQGLPAVRAGAAVDAHTQVIDVPGMAARAAAARLARDRDVQYAEPVRRVRRLAVPNDPRFLAVAGSGPAVGQWYLRAPSGEVASSIDAVSAWDTTTGSAAVVVAVLDTGVRFDHPDLAGKLLPGYDMVSDAAIANDGNGRDADASDPGDWVTQAEAGVGAFQGCTASPSSWHGTQVAGIVGAATDNGIGMAGAGWNVRVLPVRVLGKCFGYTDDIAAAIRWAAGLAVPGVPVNPNPARVINLSLGSDGACSQAEQDAINAAVGAGAVVVAAAGNSAGHAAGSPANCAGAIGVAALRHAGSKVGFSDVGPELSIAAPGGNCINVGAGEPCLYPILTTSNQGATTPGAHGYTDSVDFSVGTSYSSPLVAATAALMLSAEPALTPQGVRGAMRATARPFPQSGLPDDPFSGPLQACRAPDGSDQLQCYCTTSTCGAGMLDAGAAVRAVLGVRVTVAVTPTAPLAHQTVTFDGSGSTVAPGRTIASLRWTLVDGGGIVARLADDGSAPSTSARPSGAGRFTVRLTITDDRGVAVAAEQTVSVGADPGAPPASTAGGGGAAAVAWLAALAAAACCLRRGRSTQITG